MCRRDKVADAKEDDRVTKAALKKLMRRDK